MSLQGIFDPEPKAYFKKKFGGGGGESGGTIVNPDGSGVLKFDFNSRVGDHARGYPIFKLAEEPFRFNPDRPTPISRIKSITCDVWPHVVGYERYKELKELCKGSCEFDTYDPNELWIECPPGSGELFDMITKITDDNPDKLGVTLPPGWYIYNDLYYPASIEIGPIELG